jgi:DNA-binding FrmR family transcriptional regulator
MNSDTQADKARQKKLITRLRRVEGQLRGIQAMIERDAGCEAVAQQLAASRRALDRTFYEMIACALEAEVQNRRGPDVARDAAAYVGRILARYG